MAPTNRKVDRAGALRIARAAIARGPAPGSVGNEEWIPYGRPAWRGAPRDCFKVDHLARKIVPGFWDDDFGTFRPASAD